MKQMSDKPDTDTTRRTKASETLSIRVAGNRGVANMPRRETDADPRPSARPEDRSIMTQKNVSNDGRNTARIPKIV
jgi:hypothetical protein